MTKSFFRLMVIFHQPSSAEDLNSLSVQIAEGISAKLTGRACWSRCSELLGFATMFHSDDYISLVEGKSRQALLKELPEQDRSSCGGGSYRAHKVIAGPNPFDHGG